MLRDGDNEVSDVFKLRKSECKICGFRISYLENGIIKCVGHYETPNGLFCMNCYKNASMIAIKIGP